VSRLLTAVEDALSAARKVEQARDELVREADRLREFRVVGTDEPAGDEDGPES
jgi:hypothetical protein